MNFNRLPADDGGETKPETQEVLDFVASMDSLRRNLELLTTQYETCSKKFDANDAQGVDEAITTADRMLQRCQTDLGIVQLGFSQAKAKLAALDPAGADTIQKSFDSLLNRSQATVSYGAAVIERVTKSRQ